MLGLIGMPGPLELIIIAFIVMVMFGKGRLPELGNGLGKGIRNFKRAISGKDEIDVTPQTPKEELHETTQNQENE